MISRYKFNQIQNKCTLKINRIIQIHVLISKQASNSIVFSKQTKNFRTRATWKSGQSLRTRFFPITIQTAPANRVGLHAPYKRQLRTKLHSECGHNRRAAAQHGASPYPNSTPVSQTKKSTYVPVHTPSSGWSRISLQLRGVHLACVVRCGGAGVAQQSSEDVLVAVPRLVADRHGRGSKVGRRRRRHHQVRLGRVLVSELPTLAGHAVDARAYRAVAEID